ncbi:MAG: xylosidase [Mediterranea sp.]|jgi:hypothetical protein|nr:xylosidase [Mediterranea sp.]
MRLNKVCYLLTLCLTISVIACGGGGDDYIPPAIEEPQPEEPPAEEVYNKPDFVPHVDGEPFDSYRGLVMAGYQGWFGAPGDGCSHGNQWYHYQENGVFEPGVLRNSIDLWPDMREYEKQYTPTKTRDGETSPAFHYPDGEVATVYSAYDESSVLLHFKWMKEYGLDGVFMQRFVGEVVNNPHGKDHFDKVLASAMKGSNQYQRAICVMYDLGGFMDGETRNTVNEVLADAQSIMDTYRLKNRNTQKFYLYQNGKPMIVLWGVGFNDNRPYSLDDIGQLMDGLKEKGFSIMLGVPTYWRQRSNDALPDAKLHELIKAADVIMPWFVGRYGNDNYSNFHSLIASDIAWCEKEGVEYAPLCYPGSSDRNMHPNNVTNPRLGGQFLWNQMYHCVKSGAQMIYIAMFDEIDEGTAIYKCLNKSDVPGDESDLEYYVAYRNGSYQVFRSMPADADRYEWVRKASDLNVIFEGVEDGLPTDHYLWLVGQGRKMLRGEVPLKSSWPAR